jgi:hypothetical protein
MGSSPRENFQGWFKVCWPEMEFFLQGFKIDGILNFPEENGDTIRDIFSATLEPGPVRECLTKRG